MSGIYQFEFEKQVPSNGINDALNLSVLNVRNIFGKPKVQLDAWYEFDPEKKICLIDKSTEVGQHIAQHFVSFITRSFGEKSFTVTRLRKRKSFAESAVRPKGSKTQRQAPQEIPLKHPTENTERSPK